MDHVDQHDDHHTQLSKLRSLGGEKTEEMHGSSSDLDKFSLTQSSKQVPKVTLDIIVFNVNISL